MRRIALPLVTAVLLVLAGCAGTTGQPSAPTPQETPSVTTPADRTVSTPTPPGECPADADPPAYPDPPETLSSSTAKDVAIDSERAHRYREMCGNGHDSFGFGGAGGSGAHEATILNETADGYIVHVQVPYTITDRQTPVRTPSGTVTATPVSMHADLVGYGVYRITTATIERLRDGSPR